MILLTFIVCFNFFSFLAFWFSHYLISYNNGFMEIMYKVTAFKAVCVDLVVSAIVVVTLTVLCSGLWPTKYCSCQMIR